MLAISQEDLHVKIACFATINDAFDDLCHLGNGQLWIRVQFLTPQETTHIILVLFTTIYALQFLESNRSSSQAIEFCQFLFPLTCRRTINSTCQLSETRDE